MGNAMACAISRPGVPIYRTISFVVKSSGTRKGLFGPGLSTARWRRWDISTMAGGRRGAHGRSQQRWWSGGGDFRATRGAVGRCPKAARQTVGGETTADGGASVPANLGRRRRSRGSFEIFQNSRGLTENIKFPIDLGLK